MSYAPQSLSSSNTIPCEIPTTLVSSKTMPSSSRATTPIAPPAAPIPSVVSLLQRRVSHISILSLGASSADATKTQALRNTGVRKKNTTSQRAVVDVTTESGDKLVHGMLSINNTNKDLERIRLDI